MMITPALDAIEIDALIFQLVRSNQVRMNKPALMRLLRDETELDDLTIAASLQRLADRIGKAE